jgi:non-canonical purine NTP pyrophosphatase (RdgB/HAM1 family)
MRTIMVATTNKGKADELKSMLGPLGYKVLTPLDLKKPLPDVEEIGATYEENALLKARAIGDATQYKTLADDSGIEVDALPGKLGVYSARYAPTDASRVNKLLQALRGKKNRKARFVSCIVIYDPKTKTHQSFTGIADGSIAEKKQGTRGFGYDPIFIPNGSTKSYAELSREEKNMISHRSKALRKAMEYLSGRNELFQTFMVYLAWLQSIVATGGSLYFSEVMHLPPCVLCWYQRILMYPLALLLAVGLIRKDKALHWYVLPLSVLGLVISGYHNLLYYGILPQALAPCTAGVSCTTRFFAWFGFITIPLLSFIAFAVITTLMIVHAYLAQRKR